ncbi:MAG: hypothetical protein MPN21_20445 [Thermoanaerobaculia bacterium]|nr:hypothetical protein [Thermoanaerobaculia bacterium]
MSIYRTAARRVENTLDRFQDVNKTLLFAVLSAGGAFVGSFVGLYINPFPSPGFWHLLLWDSVLGCGIGTTVAVVQNWHLGRLTVAQRDLFSAASISAIGGLCAGFALITIKTILGFLFHPFGVTFVPHVAGWTAEGIIIAVAVSRALPNFRFGAALIAGTGAGVLGGVLTHGAFLHVTLADALKGVFIAFFLSVIERVARKAWLVVKRAPTGSGGAGRGLTLLAEPPTLSLGNEPIRIGSAPECQILLPRSNGPAVQAEVRFENGLVTLHDLVENRSKTLSAGQSLSFDGVTVEVGTRRAGANSAQT